MRKMGFNKGVALLLAMFILVFIAILVVAFLNLLTSDLTITTNHLGRLKALYIAEAGAEYVVSELRNNKGWSRADSDPAITFPSGSGSSYDVTYPKAGTTRIIESIGSVDNDTFRATIEAQVSIQGASSPYTIKIVSFQETG